MDKIHPVLQRAVLSRVSQSATERGVCNLPVVSYLFCAVTTACAVQPKNASA